jgi:oxazoline/thiazoline dehydrogenase
MIEISLANDVEFISAEEGVLELTRRGQHMKLHGIAGLESALSLIAKPYCSLADINAAAVSDWHPMRAEEKSGRRLARILHKLAERQLIQFRCLVAERPLLATLNLGSLCEFDFDGLDGTALDGTALDVCYQLSRFVCLRRAGRQMIIDCPRLSSRIAVVAPEVGALIAQLTEPATLPSLRVALPFLDDAVLTAGMAFLAGLGVVRRIEHPDGLDEDADPNLRQREFHDVLLHSYSRMGLSNPVLGASYRLAGAVPSTPAIKPVMSSHRIALPVPDIGYLMANDVPFTKVMEERRSIRSYSDSAMTLAQLGEFLYRVGRVRSTGVVGSGDERYEVTDRPCPSGGATHDLEVYVAVRMCGGLQPGLYHYESQEHSLSVLENTGTLVKNALADAYLSNARQVVPQILLIITSRFSRLSWKYEGIAYAVTLRNVGVLYEAMYLVATAMGLAPCALGSGDSGRFAKTLSLDPLVESPVGEFMLGTLPRP